MKICCVLPIIQPEQENKQYYKLLRSDHDMVKRPDTEVAIKDVPTGLPRPDLINYLGFRFLNDREILRAMILAEREGFDAVAGGCYFDGAIKAASNILGIPVVGPAESSMHFASMIGEHFAVITAGREHIAEIEQHIVECGMRDFAIPKQPVRSLSLSFESFGACVLGNYKSAIDDYIRVAKLCIEDGADVIITGCGLLAPMLTQSGFLEIEGVPLVDPMIVCLKTAEVMVDFRRAGMRIKNGSGRFIRPAPGQTDEVLRSMMGIA
jgi:allantoin racemase